MQLAAQVQDEDDAEEKPPSVEDLAKQALTGSQEWLEKANSFLVQGNGRVAELDALMLEAQQ